MFGALSSLASFSKLTGSSDDDWVDRLNHIYTVVLLGIFAVFVTTSQFVGDPIHCWCPAQFTGTHVAYAKWYCWVANTYYVPMDNHIPDSLAMRRNLELSYYQWVPVILLFMALLFKLPCLIWRVFSGGSGVDLDKLVGMTMQTQLGDPKARQETIDRIAKYLDRWLEGNRVYKFNLLVRVRQRLSRICCFFCGKREGTYLTGFYMMVKLLFIINVVGQFFLLNAFLGGFYSAYGFEVFRQLIFSREWKVSHRFPRVTLCDFQVRQMTNLQRFTIQCVLPINLFNEKIFMFLWFWFFIVATITCGNFAFWCWRTIFHTSRVRYIKKYLKLIKAIKSSEDKKVCRMFADQYLRDDGIFVLRIVGKNSNEVLLTDLIDEMWKNYVDKPLVSRISNNHNEIDEGQV